MISVLAAGLASCGPAVVYEATHEIPDTNGWAYGDTARFEFAVPDTSQHYDLSIIVAHSPDYAYENLYLNIFTDLPTGRRTVERISLDLAGDFGVWLGDCSGGRCTLARPILSNTRYQTAGAYGITLEQHSRHETLAGIQSVGLLLTEAATD